MERITGSGQITLLNIDCMLYMSTQQDKAFDLAIVDPPYGISVTSMNMGNCKLGPQKNLTWDERPPDNEYFDALKRVSSEQIIWGGAYFRQVWPCRGFIVWDKGEEFYGRSFSECELAATSFDDVSRIYKQSSIDKFRIHPAQKPVNLYKWLLSKYARPGMRIFDTHLGSGSSAIAAHYFGVDFVGCEIDPDYFAAAQKRFVQETSQLTLFQTRDL